MITVYHGSTVAIKKPDISFGRENLDFGKAFYVTRLKSQAEEWAHVVYSRYEEEPPVLNTYQLEWDAIVQKGYKMRLFEEYDKEWLDFIVSSRSGKQPWLEFDVIEGGVANDRIIDTVEGYMAGDFSVETALGRLKFHKPNNQIAILNQEIITHCMHFVSAETLL